MNCTDPDAAGDLWAQELLRVRDHQDQQAFARLYRHFAPRLRAFLIRSGSTPEIAEDCVQEALAAIWRKAHLFDPSRASATTWIFTVARNRRIDLIRRDRRPPPEELPWGPEADPAPVDVLSLRQDGDRLAVAMRALPEAQRLMVERAYWADLTHSEIAAQTGLPLGTVKSRLRLALGKLRSEMGPNVMGSNEAQGAAASA
jgi:RNA polymerase sigma factor (sigma-70 family)